MSYIRVRQTRSAFSTARFDLRDLQDLKEELKELEKESWESQPPRSQT
jgi:hypothetical protein